MEQGPSEDKVEALTLNMREMPILLGWEGKTQNGCL